MQIFYVGTWHKNKKGKVARPNFCARWLERTTRARTYAIHTAALFEAAPDIVDALVESNPQAARSRARGLLPLHIALLHGFKNGREVSVNTVRHCYVPTQRLSEYGLKTAQGNSRLPLHLAIISNVPADVIECCSRHILELWMSLTHGTQTSALWFEPSLFNAGCTKAANADGHHCDDSRVQ